MKTLELPFNLHSLSSLLSNSHLLILPQSSLFLQCRIVISTMDGASTHRRGYTLQFFAHRSCCCIQILPSCVKASAVLPRIFTPMRSLLFVCEHSSSASSDAMDRTWLKLHIRSIRFNIWKGMPFDDDTSFTRLPMLVSSSKREISQSGTCSSTLCVASAAKCAHLMSFVLPHSCIESWQRCHFQNTVFNVILCHMTL